MNIVEEKLAPATGELVAAARAAIKALNILWVSHHANRTDAAIEGLEKAI